MFSCDLCTWKTKFSYALLKAHKTRMHDITNSKSTMKKHIKIPHSPNNKRTKEVITPSSSPPLKKSNNKSQEETNLVENMEIDGVDIKSFDELSPTNTFNKNYIEESNIRNKKLESRIKELEGIL